MNTFPASALAQYGALHGLREFCAYAQRPLVVVSAKWFAVGDEPCFTEYGHLKIDPSKYATAAWDYLNPGMILNASMTEKLGIPEQSLNAERSMDSYREALNKSLKGANIVVDDTRLDIGVFGTLLAGAEDVCLIKASTVLGESHQGLCADSAGRATPIPCYDRCMLIASEVETELFLKGATHIKSLFHRDDPALSSLPDAQPSSSNEVPPSEAPVSSGPTKASSLEGAVIKLLESRKLFPVWSLDYLKGKLKDDKDYGATLEKSSVEDLDYVLSNLLRGGQLSPSKILHKDLFEKMEPYLRSIKGDEKAKLRSVKSSLEKQIGKNLDFTLVRAALMKIGHPSYRVPAKDDLKKPNSHNCKL